jgi:hypothetical protein
VPLDRSDAPVRSATRLRIWGLTPNMQGLDGAAADSTRSAKSSRSAKPGDTSAKPHSRAKKHSAGEAGDDADLQTRIARRAHEISQGDGAGDAAENWLRAEREVRGAQFPVRLVGVPSGGMVRRASMWQGVTMMLSGSPIGASPPAGRRREQVLAARVIGAEPRG